VLLFVIISGMTKGPFKKCVTLRGGGGGVWLSVTRCVNGEGDHAGVLSPCLIFSTHKILPYDTLYVALWLSGYGVGFGTERSRVRLPAAAFPSNKVNSAFHPSGVGKLSTSLHGWG